MVTTMNTQTIHCFEDAGLGKAPFAYAGMVDQNISYGQAVIGNIGGCAVTTKPGGTCDYCGTYIVNMFRVTSADGKAFKVGCECIKKTGDEGLIRKVEDAVRKMNRNRREEKKAAALRADQQLCETAQIGLLSSKPHPNAYRASQGETLADWARWMKAAKNWKTLANTLRWAGVS